MILNIKDTVEKRARILSYLNESGMDAMLLGRQDNFSWYTGGGTSKVVLTSEIGSAALVFTKEKVFCVACFMDLARIMEEELDGLDIEPVVIKWFDGSPFEKAMKLLKGLGVVSDIHIDGAENRCDDIYKLHFPLTESEIEKAYELGRETDRILSKVAGEIKPGMVDYEVEAMLLYEYGKINAIPEVILLGADERIAGYRHCIPRGKKVEKTLLMHPALRKDGLHANVARTICFGEPDKEISRRYEAACEILALAISLSKSGNTFYNIHQSIKAAFEERGFSDEWEKHFVGGASGYMLVDFSVCFDEKWIVSPRHTFDWFITITGAKVEELAVTNGKETSVASAAGSWPAKEYTVNGAVISLPQIMRL